MKFYQKISLAAVFGLALASWLFASTVSASTPTLTLTSSSDGDSVELAVTGDASASVVFYYRKTGSNLQLNYLGKTDANGAFSTTLSTTAYGISANSLVYVAVNGQKSNESAWPYLAAASVLSLSQTSLVLPLGQSSTLTAYNNGTNFIYLSSNSNPPVASVNIDGNKITVKALNFGSTVINVCAGAGTPSCAAAYVSVQNTNGQVLAFSQNNPTVAPNQNVSVSVIGGTGTYVLLNNANAGAVQASLSEHTVTLSTSATAGSSAITVCSSDMSACGIINAVVGNVSSSGLKFSQTNPIMTIGQNLSLTISGGAGGNYSILSNTNATAVSAYISNDSLTLVANAGGSATVTVCSSMGNCAAEVVTVNYSTASTGGLISLSQNNLWLLPGQASSITVSGGSMPYSASGYSENILKTSFNNNILTVTGVGGGSATVNVCSSGGGCTILSVLINSASLAAPLALSQSKLTLTKGQNSTVAISGNGGYFIVYNTNQSAATAVISGNNVVVNAVDTGPTDISVCQNGGQCAVLAVTVSGAPKITDTTASDWSNCANEKAQCAFTGSKTVRYGANNKFYYGIFSNGVACINSIFGDPIENVAKQCAYGGTIPAGATIIAAPTADASGWIDCAAEKGLCQFTGYQTVRYGANGKYHYASYLNGVACANSIFDDPIENVVKRCAYGGTIPENSTAGAPADSDTIFPAAEKFKFTKTLAYGASGDEVKKLQQRLKDEGLYGGAVDGKFLTSTMAAVKKYQKNKGIKQTGNLGALTMAALNK